MVPVWYTITTQAGVLVPSPSNLPGEGFWIFLERELKKLSGCKESFEALVFLFSDTSYIS